MASNGPVANVSASCSESGRKKVVSRKAVTSDASFAHESMAQDCLQNGSAPDLGGEVADEAGGRRKAVSKKASLVKQQVSVTRSSSEEIDAMYDDGKELVNEERYAEAAELFREVVTSKPGYRNASEYLACCEKQVRAKALEAELDCWYEQAKIAFAKNQFGEAFSLFQRVSSAAPEYRNTQQYLEASQQKCDGSDATSATAAPNLDETDVLYEKGKGLFNEDKVEEALAIFKGIVASHQDFRNASRYVEVCEERLSLQDLVEAPGYENPDADLGHEELEQAAIKIQARHRGNLAHLKSSSLSEAKTQDVLSREKQKRALLEEQENTMREERERAAREEQMEAAVKIQRRQRGRLARQESAKLRAAAKEAKAATKIQAHYRGRVLRQSLQPREQGDGLRGYKLDEEDAADGWQTANHGMLGKRVCRQFDGQSVNATVVAWHPEEPLFRIVHDDDDDEEDLDMEELHDALKLYSFTQTFATRAPSIAQKSEPVPMDRDVPVPARCAQEKDCGGPVSVSATGSNRSSIGPTFVGQFPAQPRRRSSFTAMAGAAIFGQSAQLKLSAAGGDMKAKARALRNSVFGTLVGRKPSVSPSKERSKSEEHTAGARSTVDQKYDEAMALMSAKKFAQALPLFADLHRDSPGYKDVRLRYERCRAEAEFQAQRATEDRKLEEDRNIDAASKEAARQAEFARKEDAARRAREAQDATEAAWKADGKRRESEARQQEEFRHSQTDMAAEGTRIEAQTERKGEDVHQVVPEMALDATSCAATEAKAAVLEPGVPTENVRSKPETQLVVPTTSCHIQAEPTRKGSEAQKANDAKVAMDAVPKVDASAAKFVSRGLEETRQTQTEIAEEEARIEIATMQKPAGVSASEPGRPPAARQGEEVKFEASQQEVEAPAKIDGSEPAEHVSVAAATETNDPTLELDVAYDTGKSLFEQGDYSEAYSCFREVALRRQGYRNTVDYLSLCAEQIDLTAATGLQTTTDVDAAELVDMLDAAYEKGKLLVTQERFSEALPIFREIILESTDYRNALPYLELCEEQLGQVFELDVAYANAKELAVQGRYVEAVPAFKRVCAKQPDYGNAAAYLELCESRMAEAQIGGPQTAGRSHTENMITPRDMCQLSTGEEAADNATTVAPLSDEGMASTGSSLKGSVGGACGLMAKEVAATDGMSPLCSGPIFVDDVVVMTPSFEKRGDWSPGVDGSRTVLSSDHEHHQEPQQDARSQRIHGGIMRNLADALKGTVCCGGVHGGRISPAQRHVQEVPMCQVGVGTSSASRPKRTVVRRDANGWLESLGPQGLPRDSCVFAALPDLPQLKRKHPEMSVDEYIEWFKSSASLVLTRCPRGAIAVFQQTDIVCGGRWIDKAALLCEVAAVCGATLLWHKIIIDPADIGSHRENSMANYSHLLSFTTWRGPKAVERCEDAAAGDDINLCGKLSVSNFGRDAASAPCELPDLVPRGRKLYAEGMGLESVLCVLKWLRQVRPRVAVVVDPFCGRGIVLAVANSQGFDAIGVDSDAEAVREASSLEVE